MNYNTDYKLILRQAESLTSGVTYDITILANIAALLYENLKDINWAGFYLFREGMLQLGPFQGKPACTKIPLGKGVCGTAAKQGQTILVENVHLFPGHIACDSASRSEIVVPIYREEKLYGVLDIDSPLENRFAEEKTGLEKLAARIGDHLKQR